MPCSLQALYTSVMTSDLLETMALVFCGADLSELPEDPLKLAEQAGQQLQLQFLQHNRHLGNLPVLPFSLCFLSLLRFSEVFILIVGLSSLAFK